MFVKNFLRAGDFVSVVPCGVPLTLQYNAEGLFESCFVDWDISKSGRISNKAIFKYLIENSLIPRRISVKSGTTFIFGVLYSAHIVQTSGQLPNCWKYELLDGLKANSFKFNFFASHLHSMSAPFKGASPIRKWLKMSGFNIVPGFVVPVNLTEELFENLVNTDDFTFRWPLLSHLNVFTSTGDVEIYSTELTESKILNIKLTVSDSGQFLANIYTDTPGVVIVKDYSEVLKFKLHVDDYIVYSTDNSCYTILSNVSKQSESMQVPTSLVCPYCKRNVPVVVFSDTFCQSLHCPSKLYLNTSRYLNILGFPEISREYYDNLVIQTSGKFMISDILKCSVLDSLEVSVDIATILRSLVPPTVLVGKKNFETLCNKFNRSLDSIYYYLDNPEHLLVDFNLEEVVYLKLVRWLADTINVCNIKNTISCDKVHVSLFSNSSNIEYSPIFRNKIFILTGKFVSGSILEMRNLLRDYGAKDVIFGSWEDGADCLLIGSSKEDVNSSIVNSARTSGCAIFDELEFFNKYGLLEP